MEREFYTRATVLVAKDLLGKIIVVNRGDTVYKAKIVETEAYTNDNDDAAHFHKGITNRTRVVTEEGGHVYIYNIYGIYQCFNIVAENKDIPGGVLIRAVEPLNHMELIYNNRYKKKMDNPTNKEIINLTNGPAKLVMSYGISKDEFYGADLVEDSRIWVENNGKLSNDLIVATRRINIDYAKSRDCLFRFYIKDNPFVSKNSS